LRPSCGIVAVAVAVNVNDNVNVYDLAGRFACAGE
jgi:hypothetical protein